MHFLNDELRDSDIDAWIKNSFIAGTLQDMKLHIKENLTSVTDTEMQLSAQLKALELLFDPDWIPLKQLNASFEFDGKKITIMAHDAKLNDIDLKAIKVRRFTLSIFPSHKKEKTISCNCFIIWSGGFGRTV
jgi:uncharacterized protein YhdP